MLLRLGIAVPNHGRANLAAGPLYHTRHCVLVEQPVLYFQSTCSALTLTHNQCWAWALNERDQGRLTHLLLMHSDIQPQGEQWLHMLLAEMLHSKADVLGSIIAVKSPLGLSSTALDTDRWSPQRITLSQAKRLPLTWSADNLLVNTGLLLVDMRKPWVERICFTMRDRMRRGRDGWMADFEPEDWNFSRQARALEARIFVTRAVPVLHDGIMLWPSSGEGMLDVDHLSVPAAEVMLTDALGRQVSFDPQHDATMDAADALFPAGWLSRVDMEMYRHVYSDLVPQGGASAEIGVYRGRSLTSVADIIARKHISVRCVDTFDTPLLCDTNLDRLECFRRIAADHGILPNLQIMNCGSVEASRTVPDQSLDFIFIDGSHDYPSVKDDIASWRPKLKPGGWIGGHDYDDMHVRRAVNEKFEGEPRTLNTSIWLTQVRV
jgi:hypothetical protein